MVHHTVVLLQGLLACHLRLHRPRRLIGLALLIMILYRVFTDWWRILVNLCLDLRVTLIRYLHRSLLILDWVEQNECVTHDSQVVHDLHVLVIELLHHAFYALVADNVNLILLILLVDSLAEDPK